MILKRSDDQNDKINKIYRHLRVYCFINLCSITAVILTPTRELAMQISRECKRFCKSLQLNTVCVYGGTGISEQIAELKRGAEIIVCTPGRMIDMLAANGGKSCLFLSNFILSTESSG